MTSVLERYRTELQQRGHVSDAAQLAAVERLDRLATELEQFRHQREGLIGRFLRKPEVPRGVWMWGGVGRGKSFLMDCFFESVDIRRKVRLHFHEFMRGVHRELRELRSVSDPLDEVARRVAERHRLVCFDEFHLSDIADAMILERLLSGLFRHGVVFVMTSNYRPDDLYPDGLHREAILPAIDLLNREVDVINVDSGTDYRQIDPAAVKAYITPLGPQAEAEMQRQFDRLSHGQALPATLEVENRQIQARRVGERVAWFDFDVLCGGPRSQNDYLELARRFDTIMLGGVPQMDAGMASEARRFLWLVDVFYDQKVKLIMSAAVEPEQLYTSGAMASEFVRTASRLTEMQSAAYLAEARRTVADRLV